MPTPVAIQEVFARRWAVPALALLWDGPGAKLVTLTRRLDAPRASVKGSLSLLADLGLVASNEGYGHPMRPEYVLTERGRLVAPPAAALVAALDRAGAIETGLRKWSMPVLRAVDLGADRFAGITQSLAGATDRAVSLTLSELGAAALIGREIIDGRPPRPSYALARAARPIAPVLADLDAALTH